MVGGLGLKGAVETIHLEATLAPYPLNPQPGVWLNYGLPQTAALRLGLSVLPI